MDFFSLVQINADGAVDDINFVKAIASTLSKVKSSLMPIISVCVQGHSVNVLTIDHVTPLHEACVGDHVACARALIDAGANVSHTFRLEIFFFKCHVGKECQCRATFI